ncbi:MAG: cyclic nucleotide-binding domain-containing protein, partial [Candidatus Hydrogenedentota bacterium]
CVFGGEIEVGDGKRFSSIIGPGEPLGEMAWVSDAPRSLTATALERTSMLTLNEEVVRQLLSKESSVQLLMNIILAVSERLRAANSR